ncbi:MAG: alpha-galactosidase, partial [Alistipes sp.]|nr:alpha-galactosidase [Alistipes sp.]
MEQCAQWMAPRFQRAPVTQSLPFHFIYQGTGSDSLLQGCTPQVIQRTLDENRTQEQWIYTLTDGLEIRCEMVRYADYPAVEWTLYLKNNGSARSGILEQIEALHAPFHPRTQSTLYLNYNEGGHSGDKDFAARRTTLNNGEAQTMGAFWGGFPTAENLPFFNAEWCGADTSGIMVGVGWPARWQTSFLKTADSVLTICVGQIKTHLYLNPGEEIRTPLVALMFWQGNRDQAQNMWRGWMYDHNLPRPDGKLPSPILEAASSAFFAEMFHATDKDQIEFIDRYLEEGINLDYWWMDAGWYPHRGGSWQDLLGTWYPDPKRYPNGLKAISDHAHQRGVKSLLWFEPERVTEGSWIFQYHPEWTLGSGNPRFFNYGNPEALAWMIHHTDSLLKSEHIDLYRQDFAVFSDGYWNGEDQKDPDRQGIAEIRHVIGYLQYMDELQRRHPKMLIDICAAGGKRLELENLRR